MISIAKFSRFFVLPETDLFPINGSEKTDYSSPTFQKGNTGRGIITRLINFQISLANLFFREVIIVLLLYTKR